MPISRCKDPMDAEEQSPRKRQRLNAAEAERSVFLSLVSDLL